MTMSTPSINLLPQHILLSVFERLPLLDLLHANQVCRTWIELRLIALSRRKHLYILKSSADLKKLDVPEYNSFKLLRYLKEDDGVTPFLKLKVRLDRHALYTKVFTAKQLDQIVKLMPNVKVLRIIQAANYFDLWKIKCLVNCYCQQLVDFTLWFLNPSDHNETEVDEDIQLVSDRFQELITSLLCSINSLPALHSLELNLKVPQYCIPLPVEVDLPIASRLKTLKIQTFGFTDGHLPEAQAVLQPLFEREDLRSANSSLEELYVSGMPMAMELAISAGPRISYALRDLNIQRTNIGDDDSIATLKQLASQCPNLHDLTVSLLLPLSKIGPLAQALAPCKALVHLTIRSSIERDRRFQQRVELQMPNAAIVEAVPPEADQQQQQPVLPSVKALSLFIDTHGHRDYEKMNLPAIFPNVQAIFVWQKRDCCSDCSYPKLQVSPESWVQSIETYQRNVIACIRLERASFRQFPKLTTLQSHLSGTFGGTVRTHTLNRDNLDMVFEYHEEVNPNI